MSDSITEHDHMAFTGQTPWHGKGTLVEDGMTPEEMRDAAHLGWRVETASLFYREPVVMDGTLIEKTIPQRVMYRSDTGAVLDVVGPKYVPAQNDEVLAFFRDYLGEGGMSLSTAGSLCGGRYVWGLASLRKGFELPGGDAVTGHVLVANANKYGRGLIVKFVQERVVCHNTLTMALSESGSQVTIAHNRPFDDTARKDAARRLGLAVSAFDDAQLEATVMSHQHLTEAQVEDVIAATFRLPSGEERVKMSRAAKRVQALYDGAAAGADLASAAGTAWGLLNAVTQYVDHEHGRTDDGRLRHAWFGGGEAVKLRARRALLALEAA